MEMKTDKAKPGTDESIVTYMGQDIETLSREELIEALKIMGRLGNFMPIGSKRVTHDRRP